MGRARSSLRVGRAHLRTTRALAALVALVALVAGAGVWQVLETRRGIAAQARIGNESLARAAAAALGAQIQTQVDRVRFLAARPELPAFIGEGDEERLQQAVDFVGLLYPDFVSATIIGVRGRVLAHWPDPRSIVGRDLPGTNVDVLGAVRTPVVSAPVELPGSIKGVHITAGLRGQDGTLAGFLRLGYPIGDLRSIQRDISISGEGSMLLLDEEGRILWGITGRSDVVGIPARDEERSGHLDLMLPGREGRRIAGWATIPDVGWTVLVEQSASSALEGATAVATRMGIIVLLVSILAAVAATFVGRLLRQVTRERNRSTAILSSIADGAITIDSSGRIRTMNAAMRTLTGWKPAEAAGRPLSEVVELQDAHGRPVPAEASVLPRAIATGEPVASRGFDLSVVARDGTRTPVGVTAAPILSDDGDLIGGVAVFRDISYERELDDMKSALISTVSHELRTPLTMIQGFSELLLDRDVDAERRKQAVGYINGSAQRLARMIEDLLQVSHLDAGRVPVRVVPTDLTGVVHEALSPFRDQHPDRLFVADIAGAPPVAGDADMIARVLTNLLSNAVKYSPDGTRVEVRARASGERVIIEVSDRGIGLSEEEAARLFDRFFRSSHPDVQRVAGSGLGLYITRGLVQLQGGDIWATGEPGRGSTFAFSLLAAGSVAPAGRERSA